MPFSIRPYRRFPVQCAVTYNTSHSSRSAMSEEKNKKHSPTLFAPFCKSITTLINKFS